MKALILPAACILAFATAPTSFAQLQDNTEKQMTCDNNQSDGGNARHCEIREQTVPSAGTLQVDPGQNGGASIKGWLRSTVLVRARIESSAETAAAANALASQVTVDSSGGRVHAMGPESQESGSWSVSYEIFVPQSTDLTVKAHNGGISISDVRGQIHFEGTNGGVHLRRVAGDVSGTTVNGGLQVELAGNIWDGRQMDVSTHNGGISISMPSYYSAHIQAETTSGSIQSDFPAGIEGARRTRKLDFNVGSGGPLIHVATENGGVKLRKTDTQ